MNPNDDCWNHGTSSGAIIAGNGNLGNAYRGATAITLDSWKVYPTTTDANGACTGGLDAAAAVRGFEAAVAAIDRVIVAEMQGVEDETGVISSAADKAFEAGAVVIAANGNFGPGDGSVRAPAKAHMVIGVGDFNVASGAQIGSQGRGPTADGRYKPDIQAPTESETASNASDTALRVFNGTSGATPYAGAVAALLRNWLRGGTGSIDPGQVYAHLILIGQTPWPFNNTSGAGKLRMPTNGLSWWGKVKVADGATIDIPITVADAGGAGVDAALWWPEMATQQHNDVDVALVRPDGTEAASSLSTVSVFERARASGAVPAGLWHVSVRGFHVPVGPQTVYWAARWAR
ncbi:MAG: S8 family serine peptidase [Anaerolineae bacterium]